MKKFALLAVSAFAAIAAPAFAAPVTYTLSGDFSLTSPAFGQYNGPLTVTGTGDTDDFQTLDLYNAAVNVFELSSLVVDFDGGSFDLGSGFQFGAGPAVNAFGFLQSAVAGVAAFQSPELAGYDGTTSLGSTAVSYFLGSPFSLYGSPVVINGASNTVFSANVTSVAAVPEPATWAMLIGGFGLVGGTLRRRRSVTVSKVGFAAA